MNSEESGRKVTRRGFLLWFSWFLGGLVALSIGITSVAYLISDPTGAKRKRSVKLVPVSDLKEDEPVLYEMTYPEKDAWTLTEKKDKIYVIKRSLGDYLVLSTVCTHLGCQIAWDTEKKEFLCPCHGGRYDIDGKVISGPPPKPLKTFESEIKDDWLYVV